MEIPAGIENGAQMLMQDVVRTQQHRVSLVVQVRHSLPLHQLIATCTVQPLFEHVFNAITARFSTVVLCVRCRASSI